MENDFSMKIFLNCDSKTKCSEVIIYSGDNL